MTSQASDNETNEMAFQNAVSMRRRISRLCIAIATIAVVWCCLLPWVSEQPSMQAHLNWLDQNGIDPSAMYYTELDAMKPILQRLERHR